MKLLNSTFVLFIILAVPIVATILIGQLDKSGTFIVEDADSSFWYWKNTAVASDCTAECKKFSETNALPTTTKVVRDCGKQGDSTSILIYPPSKDAEEIQKCQLHHNWALLSLTLYISMWLIALFFLYKSKDKDGKDLEWPAKWIGVPIILFIQAIFLAIYIQKVSFAETYTADTLTLFGLWFYTLSPFLVYYSFILCIHRVELGWVKAEGAPLESGYTKVNRIDI